MQPWTLEVGATVDLRRRCKPWTLEEGATVTLEEGATVTLEEGATVDLRRRCNRGPEKKVQP